ncbi:TerB family tellurite resistance protein [Sulfidibacter corallicola]|uniref:TerB family tellurite resistance protein n=1 Tax=Sulfidibacter corallicola TaxID=2818388 RepID=A0A8A4TJK1_SULCO|nr:TerB family tellurite resistance protein [Sulfidibacter corallicola]QTD48978.1 TerB family tellurite resistance protein [Sulfidibacter corallicola]
MVQTPKPLIAALRLWAKMAVIDGKVHPDERSLLEFLIQVHAPDTDIDYLLGSVRDIHMDDLIATVTTYEDRFFIAMNAYALATVDEDYSDRERRFFDRLSASFSLSEEDLDLLKQTVANEHSEDPQPPDPRLEDLFSRSNFCEAE